MTTPKVATVQRGGSRFYVNPTTHEKVPGVTSILSMLPKPFLKAWGEKVAAEFAVENIGAVTQLVINGQRKAAVDMIKGASRRYTSDRADIGTEVHDYYDRLSRGEDIGKVHPDVQPYIDHWHQFNKDFAPKFLMNEETVWSDTHRYAGSFDWIAEIAGEIVVGDWKTTKSTYPEVALQLSAYRYADYVVRPDGAQVPIPKITGGAVMHVGLEGYELIPAKCDEEVFEVFLGLRNIVFEWDKEISKSVLGRPLAPIVKGAK